MLALLSSTSPGDGQSKRKRAKVRENKRMREGMGTRTSSKHSRIEGQREKEGYVPSPFTFELKSSIHRTLLRDMHGGSTGHNWPMILP